MSSSLVNVQEVIALTICSKGKKKLQRIESKFSKTSFVAKTKNMIVESRSK